MTDSDRRPRAPIPHTGDLSFAPRRGDARPVPATVDEAIEERMDAAREARPDLDDAARKLAILERSEIETSRQITKTPERSASVSLPDAFAEKTANTMDMATASIIERIRGIKARCERIEIALIDDSGETKRRIHATIDFATKAETLAKSIDAELDAIIEQHKQNLRAR